MKDTLPIFLSRLFGHRADDRPTRESSVAPEDDEPTVANMGPARSARPTKINAAMPLSPRDEPTINKPRPAVNLADRPDEEATATGSPIPPPLVREPVVGAVRSSDYKSDPGWAKNAPIPEDDPATAVTGRGGDVWTPDLEEKTGETEAPPRPVFDASRARRPKKKRVGCLGCLTRLFVLALLLTSAAAATWVFRERLPPTARARVESLPDHPVVQRAFVLAEERGWRTALAPTPTPVDLVLSTAAEIAMATATPEPTETVAPTPAVTPVRTSAPTPTIVARQTPKPTPRSGASVRIVSTPPGHEILVDGRGTGKRTPATIYIPAGDHVLSIEAEGFKVWSFQESLQDGDTLVLQANLIPR